MNCLFILLLLCCCGGNKGVGGCEEHDHSYCKEKVECAPVRRPVRCEVDVIEEKCDRVRYDFDCREQENVRGKQWDYPRFNVNGCNENCGCEEERRGCDCIRK